MTTITKKRITKKKKNKDLSHFDLYINEFWSIQKEYDGFEIVKKEKSLLSWILRFVFFVPTLFFFDYFNFNTLINRTLYTGARWEKLSWNEKYEILCKKRKHLKRKKENKNGN